MSQHHDDIGKHFNLRIFLCEWWNWGKERAAKLLKVVQEACSWGRSWIWAIRISSHHTLPSAQPFLLRWAFGRFSLTMVSSELCKLVVVWGTKLHGEVLFGGQLSEASKRAPSYHTLPFHAPHNLCWLTPVPQWANHAQQTNCLFQGQLM